MLGRRLYSGISRGAGAARACVPPTHASASGAHAGSSGGSGGAGSAATSSSRASSSSTSTRGRTKSSRQCVRVRSLYSPPQWVSQLIHGTPSHHGHGTGKMVAQTDGMTLRSVPIESIDALLSRSTASHVHNAGRGGRQRPFALRRSILAEKEKSMVDALKEAKPLFVNPLAKDYTFRPVPLYPSALHSHLAFTPAHLPIPANLGTAIYNQPRSSSPSSNTASFEDLFSPPAAPSPVRRLERVQRKANSAMTEHMSIISVLSHPSHLAALPTGFETLAASSTMLGMGHEGVEEHMARTLAEAETKNQIMAEREFAKAMEILEGSMPASSQASVDVEGEKQDAQMGDVLQGVEALLGRLSAQGSSAGAGPTVEAAVDMGEDVIEMDSVKRKRKKKISKHKYKKRRKATRAQRKRLGK